jgi:hypothetical protein
VEALFAVGSRMNLWQEARFFSPDVDGDGRADLAVAYWKGLKDSRVVIDVYLRNEDGSFQPKARSTAFDVEDGDRSWLRYGDDLDGDGRPDLMIRSGNALHVHRGLASVKGAKLVDRGPIEVPLEDDDGGENTISVTIGGGDEGIRSWSNDDGPTVVDLAPGADGPRAIVARGTAQDGRDLLRIVRLDGRGD